jgi:hypothetical protein
MQLELLPRLPDDAKVFLEIPLEFAETLRERFARRDHQAQMRRATARRAVAPLPPAGGHLPRLIAYKDAARSGALYPTSANVGRTAHGWSLQRRLTQCKIATTRE